MTTELNTIGTNFNCGIACLEFISKLNAIPFDHDLIKQIPDVASKFISIRKLLIISELIGFRVLAVMISFGQLCEIPTPSILFYHENHFIVLIDIMPNCIDIYDPSLGQLRVSIKNFQQNWFFENNTGICVLIKPQKSKEF